MLWMEFMCTHIKARNPAAHLHVESNTDAQTLTTQLMPKSSTSTRKYMPTDLSSSTWSLKYCYFPKSTKECPFLCVPQSTRNCSLSTISAAQCGFQTPRDMMGRHRSVHSYTTSLPQSPGQLHTALLTSVDKGVPRGRRMDSFLLYLHFKTIPQSLKTQH